MRPIKERVFSPFLIAAFVAGLASHPNKELLPYVCTGLEHGFHLEINLPEQRSETAPLPSAREAPAFITEYLQDEVKAGRMSVYHALPHPFTVETAVGVVPKKSYDPAVKKWRLIAHLSKELGDGAASINDHIDADDFSCDMLAVEEAIEIMRGYGSTCTFSICDVKAGFRTIPVHPSNYHHQVVRWKDAYWVDHRLCFGSRASPFIFTTVTQSIEYIIQRALDKKLGLRDDGTRRAVLVHFVDDFCCIAENKAYSKRATKIMLDMMAELGVPLAPDKTKKDVQHAVYLGLLLDARRGTVTIPDDKAANLRSLFVLLKSSSCASMRKRDLDSLIGKATYARIALPWLRHTINPFLKAAVQVTNPMYRCKVTPDMRAAAATWIAALDGIIDGSRPARRFDTLPLALTAFELGVGGSANLAAYSGDAAGEIGFGFRDPTGRKLYWDRWSAEERASHTLKKADAFVGPAGRQSSTLQEAKCLVAAALTWLETGPPPGSIFRYRTDSKNCFYLANKMRSKTEAVNRLWAKLAEQMDRADCFVDVLWQRRDTEDAQLADLLSRCPSLPELQAYRSRANQPDATRCQLNHLVRSLVRN